MLCLWCQVCRLPGLGCSLFRDRLKFASSTKINEMTLFYKNDYCIDCVVVGLALHNRNIFVYSNLDGLARTSTSLLLAIYRRLTPLTCSERWRYRSIDSSFKSDYVNMIMAFQIIFICTMQKINFFIFYNQYDNKYDFLSAVIVECNR